METEPTQESTANTLVMQGQVGGPGVCLGYGQTEAEGVPSQGGRGDALLRRMPPDLT